ncbi:calcium-binding protein [Aurantiacibacter sp. MUD61]|uniref:calcium-binding protein n=1 Tax=Aurantiacibacter sp. MUD61 TaxID=3009083 RepID=UPI0022EFE65C|nr:hypothetical protein [Aurantiacibacter sp. MUD61]
MDDIPWWAFNDLLDYGVLGALGLGDLFDLMDFSLTEEDELYGDFITNASFDPNFGTTFSLNYIPYDTVKTPRKGVVTVLPGGDYFGDMSGGADSGFGSVGAPQYALINNGTTTQVFENSGVSTENGLSSPDWAAGGVAAAKAFSSSIGRRLFGDNALAGALVGSVLSEVAGDISGRLFYSSESAEELADIFSRESLSNLGVNIAGAGAGALTSYFVGEAFAKLGIDGFAGEALNSTASFALSTIASNIVKDGASAAFDGLGTLDFAGFAGSFLGSKLASFVKTFDSVGGQIGFSVGGAVGGALAASVFAKSSAIIANFLAPGVGAFVGALLGGVIGSLFGGNSTPESGAHVVWNAALGEFTTGASWADDWGSSSDNQKARERAIDLATSAGDVLNRVIDGLGTSASAYQNPTRIGAGAYGQENSDFVYWGAGENSQNHSLTGSYDNSTQALNHGIRVALDSVTLQGGDIYLKRALYKTLEENTDRASFDFGQLLGDLSVAADYSFYQSKAPLIDAAIALAPESALAQGWILTLLRSSEMGFDDFHKSDFYGGLHGFLEGSPFLNGVDPADIELNWQGGDLRISAGETVRGGNATVAGWSSASNETTRWRMVEGPGGETITAMETGQNHGAANGGGITSSNAVTIDGSKGYEFTVYVQGHTLNKHRAYFGTMSNTVVNAVSGSPKNNPYFWSAIPGSGNSMQADKWYKVVAYILPEGERLSAQADMGGVYDASTGEKIANVTNYAWDPARTRSTTALRFFNYYDEAKTGYSTYWAKPQIRTVDGTTPTSGNLIDTSGWADDPQSSMVIDNFASTMGYRRTVNITANYTGSIYSDIVTATGSNNITISDAVSASSMNGPGMTGSSRLSDDIFIGNDGHNQIYGYAGWDWLDGGAGVDRIYGGSGNDFIKGGDGNDYVQNWTNGPAPGGLYGEDGDDTIHGGAGKDAMFGGNGNDLFLADDDNIWDYMNGQAGSDTISYRLFDRAVTIDMNVGKDTSYTYRAYGDGAVGIENVAGTRYADTLIGDSQHNVLDGGASDDTISGGSGNDTLIGGTGRDTLNGNAGSDTVSYRHSNSGVTVDLTAGTASGGEAHGDSFTSIESIEGSSHSDDLRARAATGKLAGLGGSDILRASTGAIAFDGGEGIDTVDYADSTAGVYVNLGSGTGSGGWAAGDTYSSIEQVIGSNFGDTIHGTDESERFQAGAGNDYMYGKGGDDSYGFTDGTGVDYVTDTGGFYDYMVVDGSISLNDLTMSRSGSTLVLGRKSTSDKMYVQSHFSTDSQGLKSYTMDRLTFENGSWLWISHLTSFQNGGGGNNTLHGTGQSDWLHGYSGNDVINGGEGLDVLIGGAGTDTLRGGAHSDTYIFGRGSGVDIIDDTGGYETLVFAGDIKSSDLMIEYSGNDLYIGLKVDGQNYTAFNAPDRVKIIGQKTLAKAVEYIQINGHKLSLPKLVGDATGSSSPPQVEDRNITIYSRFTGGAITTINAYDPEGDTLTFSVTSHTSNLNEDYYMLNGGSQLYTTAYWNRQDYEFANVTVTASDGTSTGSGTVSITYAPDPMGGPIWPIVMDLDGDGVELVKASKSSVAWDVDEDGLLDNLGWISGDDAFLALDRDGSGAIDDISEISFIQDAEGATTDLEGLRGFDFDAEGVSDGKLDSNDVFYANFLLWQDANANGISEEGELKTLAEHGIVSIDLTGEPTNDKHKKTSKNAVLNSGTFTYADGSAGGFGDVVLGVEHGGSEKDSSKAFTRKETSKLFARDTANTDTADFGGELAPIVIDFDLNGLELTPVGRSQINFDADGDGDLERIGWISGGDGILALDLDGDNAITSGQEISFSQYAGRGATDLEGLRTFDGNEDGILDAGDAIWQDLKIWFDSNHDGVTQDGELVSIIDTSVATIELFGQQGRSEYGGNAINEVTKVTFSDFDGFAGLADVSLGYLELKENVQSKRAAPAPMQMDKHIGHVEGRHSAMSERRQMLVNAYHAEYGPESLREVKQQGTLRSQDLPLTRSQPKDSSLQGYLRPESSPLVNAVFDGLSGVIDQDAALIPQTGPSHMLRSKGEESAMLKRIALIRQDLCSFGASCHADTRDNNSIMREHQDWFA